MDMTPERALVAARNSEIDEWIWKHQRVPGAFAHQFGVQHGWMTSRCGDARWTVNWWPAPESAARCEKCSEIAEMSLATNVRAILAVAERKAVA